MRFFEIWYALPDHATAQLDIPRYLQLLTLLSFHVFISEKVDVAIYETHLGGEFDATNIIRHPVITAITSISMDHTHLLGEAIEDIAWHKAGIFKTGSLAFSAPQTQDVVTTLQVRAAQKAVTLEFVDIDSALPCNAVALKPKVQKINCSLAVQIARVWTSLKSPVGQSYLNNSIVCGIEQFSWVGLFEEIVTQNGKWYLDGAHNAAALRHTIEWFAETATKNNDSRILIFSQFSKRDGTLLLQSLLKSLRDNSIRFDHVIFTSYNISQNIAPKIDRNLQLRFSPEIAAKYVETWEEFEPTASVSLRETIQDALDLAKSIGNPTNDGMQVLITGSLHLVSGALYLLCPEIE